MDHGVDRPRFSNVRQFFSVLSHLAINATDDSIIIKNVTGRAIRN